MRSVSSPPSFESLVNTEGFQTVRYAECKLCLFESLVNTEGFQTWVSGYTLAYRFESLVNTEGFQTSESKRGRRV